jgi:hypothetical protein
MEVRRRVMKLPEKGVLHAECRGGQDTECEAEAVLVFKDRKNAGKSGETKHWQG